MITKKNSILDYANSLNQKQVNKNFSKKFSEVSQSIENVANVCDIAKTQGFIFIANYRFKSLTDPNNDKTIIKTQNYGTSVINKSIIEILNKTNNEEYKSTAAIQYSGSSEYSDNVAYYKRQFWYEDIEPIPIDILLSKNYDAGIYIRHLSKLENIEIQKTDYIDLNEYINLNPNNNLDGMIFIPKFNNFYLQKSNDIIISRNKLVYKDENVSDWRNKNNSNLKYDNDTLLFKLKNIGINEYLVLMKDNNNWIDVPIIYEKINQSTTKNNIYPPYKYNTTSFKTNINIDEINSPKSFMMNANLQLSGPSQATISKSYFWLASYGNCGQDLCPNYQTHHIIIPSYRDIYKKILNNPDMGISRYNCKYGLGNDELIKNILIELDMPTESYNPSLGYSETCRTLFTNYCGYIENNNYYPNLLKNECINYCNETNINCDLIVQNYCDINKPTGNNLPSDDYISKCGCYLNSNYYNKIINAMPQGFQLPTCEKKYKFPSLCGNGVFTDYLSKNEVCKSNVVNCLQSIKFNNEGGEINANVYLNQNISSCKLTSNSTTSNSTTSNSTTSNSTKTEQKIPDDTTQNTKENDTKIPENDTKTPENDIGKDMIYGIDKKLFFIGCIIVVLIIMIIAKLYL